MTDNDWDALSDRMRDMAVEHMDAAIECGSLDSVRDHLAIARDAAKLSNFAMLQIPFKVGDWPLLGKGPKPHLAVVGDNDDAA